MITALHTILSTDTALMAILTGGFYNADEITRQATPGAYDIKVRLKPCGLIKPETQVSLQPHPQGSRLFVTVWLYSQAGRSDLEPARNRIYQLLHDNYDVVPSDGSGCWRVEHADDLLGRKDPDLQAHLEMSRYACTLNRSYT